MYWGRWRNPLVLPISTEHHLNHIPISTNPTNFSTNPTDYAVKVRVAADKKAVDLANVKMSMNPFCEVRFAVDGRVLLMKLVQMYTRWTLSDSIFPTFSISPLFHPLRLPSRRPFALRRPRRPLK
jgi:hypothetical protein